MNGSVAVLESTENKAHTLVDAALTTENVRQMV